MKKVLLCFCAGFLFVSLTADAFADDVFDRVVNVIYLKNGEPMRCRIGAIEGTRAVCQNFGGSASVPLRIIDLEKTFPKFKGREGETIILVYPGEVYQDENIILSNLLVVREDEKGPVHDRSPSDRGSSRYVILFDVMNRGDSCEISATVAMRDKQGNIFQRIEVPSGSRVRAGDVTVVKKRVEFTEGNLEDQIGSLKIGPVERKNILAKSEAESSPSVTKLSRADLREEKVRALTESFLRERPQQEQK
jgi:hypothetical protein